MTKFLVTGKDVRNCQREMLADGFVRTRVGLQCDEEAKAKFEARGFRVKVYYTPVERIDNLDPNSGIA